jgi:hypothetical protein
MPTARRTSTGRWLAAPPSTTAVRRTRPRPRCLPAAVSTERAGFFQKAVVAQPAQRRVALVAQGWTARDHHPHGALWIDRHIVLPLSLGDQKRPQRLGIAQL